MAQPLEQLTIAILEHRFTKEFSTLLERFGASVYACPLLEEKPVENREELEEFVRQLAAGTFDAMIFLTGVGARFLVSAAESAGLKNEFLEALNKMTIVVRGPKPVAALRCFFVPTGRSNATTSQPILNFSVSMVCNTADCFPARRDESRARRLQCILVSNSCCFCSSSSRAFAASFIKSYGCAWRLPRLASSHPFSLLLFQSLCWDWLWAHGRAVRQSNL